LEDKNCKDIIGQEVQEQQAATHNEWRRNEGYGDLGSQLVEEPEHEIDRYGKNEEG
jgi:hypothetical protein